MNDDNLDRSLSKEEQILPSSGFTASVMEAVRREAATPPPIPFPWKRALPGIMVSWATIFWMVFEGIRQIGRGTGAIALPAWFGSSLSTFLATPRVAAGYWIALALVLSFASVELSMHLARRTNS